MNHAETHPHGLRGQPIADTRCWLVYSIFASRLAALRQRCRKPRQRFGIPTSRSSGTQVRKRETTGQRRKWGHPSCKSLLARMPSPTFRRCPFVIPDLRTSRRRGPLQGIGGVGPWNTGLLVLSSARGRCQAPPKEIPLRVESQRDRRSPGTATTGPDCDASPLRPFSGSARPEYPVLRGAPEGGEWRACRP
jgi:hypothetical protein